MHFYSTRNPALRADLKSALLSGLAPDGGLYLPDALPTIDAATQKQWRAFDFPTLAAALARTWCGEALGDVQIDALAREAYTFPLPVRPVGRHWCLELFHGPSASFKDVAAQWLLRLLDTLLTRDGERALILTATSGDTGSAVAAACAGRSAIDAVILYPHGRISPVQEQQITAFPAGGNVHPVAVQGTFDDCQRLVKTLLADSAWCTRHLTSANSINIGRLLPQMAYYWWSALQCDGPLIAVVPSGNFGNLTAGVLARRMGAPIDYFLAATNANDAVPRYLAGGAYEPQATRATISNAMDVSDPSNFERLRTLYADDITAMRNDIIAVAVADDATRSAMHAHHAERGAWIDPHTAVAWTALQRWGAQHPDWHGLVLATADAAKFPEVSRAALGAEPPVPPQLAACASAAPYRLTLETPDAAAVRALIQQTVDA